MMFVVSPVFEVDMVVSLVNYVLKQGYSVDDVVVLTPYLGQVIQLSARLDKARIDDRDQHEINRLDEDHKMRDAAKRGEAVAVVDVPEKGVRVAVRGCGCESPRVYTPTLCTFLTRPLLFADD
jgi:hypothetical protein